MNHSLIEADDSVFIVIDVQDHFLAKLEKTQSQSVIERICWLAGVANWLGIPIIATAEDIDRTGPASNELKQALGPNVPIRNKMIFGLADQSDLLADVESF